MVGEKVTAKIDNDMRCFGCDLITQPCHSGDGGLT